MAFEGIVISLHEMDIGTHALYVACKIFFQRLMAFIRSNNGKVRKYVQKDQKQTESIKK